MKRYDIGVHFTSGVALPMVECDDGVWVNVEDVKQVENENVALERRLRGVAKTLVEGLGAEGPMSAEEAAGKAVETLQNARNELQETKKDLCEMEASISTLRRKLPRIAKTLREGFGIEKQVSAEEAASMAVDAIREAREEAEKDAAENRFLRRQLEAEKRGLYQELEHERDELSRKLRSVTQTLAEELGAERPISAEGAASMAVDAIREARAIAREREGENRELHYRLLNIARQIPDWPIDE